MSPEMFEEARHYNMDAVTNNAIKRRTDVLTGIWFVGHLPVTVLSFCYKLIGQTFEDMGWFGAGEFDKILTFAALGAMILGITAYIGLIAYYVIFRFQRDPKLILMCSLPILLTLFPYGIFFVAINVIMAMWYTKTDEKLSTEAGYPAFVRLNVTTVDSEAESMSNLTYDSIRERTKHRLSDDDQFL